MLIIKIIIILIIALSVLNVIFINKKKSLLYSIIACFCLYSVININVYNFLLLDFAFIIWFYQFYKSKFNIKIIFALWFLASALLLPVALKFDCYLYIKQIALLGILLKVFSLFANRVAVKESVGLFFLPLVLNSSLLFDVSSSYLLNNVFVFLAIMIIVLIGLFFCFKHSRDLYWYSSLLLFFIMFVIVVLDYPKTYVFFIATSIISSSLFLIKFKYKTYLYLISLFVVLFFYSQSLVQDIRYIYLPYLVIFVIIILNIFNIIYKKKVHDY